METLGIRKVKRPGPRTAWSAYVVARDDHGTWAFTPTGSIVKSDAPGDNGTPFPHESGFLTLIPTDQWWFAGWWIRDGERRVGTDASTPTTLTDNLWTWIDLELDVIRETGAVWVEDEDEFEDARVAGHINDEESGMAAAATAWLVHQLSNAIAPFDDTGWRYFDQAAALRLPPLDAPI